MLSSSSSMRRRGIGLLRGSYVALLLRQRSPAAACCFDPILSQSLGEGVFAMAATFAAKADTRGGPKQPKSPKAATRGGPKQPSPSEPARKGAPRQTSSPSLAKSPQRERQKHSSFLSAEIERMKRAYEIYNKTPPKPFRLEDNAGKLDIILQRRKGRENLQVRCELLFHPRGGPPEDLTPEELEGEEQRVIVNLTMTITKGGSQALDISVQCDRRGYAINYIKYREDKDVTVEDDENYFPEFWKINSELRAEFHKFLEARGLDEELADWVHDQMDNKAFQMRLKQLEKVNAFVEDSPLPQ